MEINDNKINEMKITDELAWKIIRKMVSEKHGELQQVICSLFYTETEQKKACKEISAAIKGKFLGDKLCKYFDERGERWRDCISSVDLLYLYNFYNRILSSFYKQATYKVEETNCMCYGEKQYKIVRTGEIELGNEGKDILQLVKTYIARSATNCIHETFKNTKIEIVDGCNYMPAPDEYIKSTEYRKMVVKYIVNKWLKDRIKAINSNNEIVQRLINGLALSAQNSPPNVELIYGASNRYNNQGIRPNNVDRTPNSAKTLYCPPSYEPLSIFGNPSSRNDGSDRIK